MKVIRVVLSILHADIDACFAAVETLDDPSLIGQPLIIGYPGPRGVVSTASYEARRFGVHSAMPSVEAMRRCPHGIWRQPRGKRYAAISREVMTVFRHFTPEVEPLSLDEAFLEVSGSRRLFGTAIEIAEQIRKEVKKRTGLVVSIGVAENKFLAKVASDLSKPDGLTVVPVGRGAEFLSPLPLRRLWGVGPKTGQRLSQLGIKSVGDLARLDRKFLSHRFGDRTADQLWRLSRGMDARPVEQGRQTKSISTESTFPTDLVDLRAIEDYLFKAANEVACSLRKSGSIARTVNIKVRTGSFQTSTRSESLDRPTDLAETIFHTACTLFKSRIDLKGEGVRLLGISASNLIPAGILQQETLFDAQEQARARSSEQLIDKIVAKEGDGSIQLARLLRTPKQSPRGPAQE